MEITVTGRKMQVTDTLRDYATEKIGGACKVFDIDPMNVEIVLHVEKNPSISKSSVVEVTLRTKGHVIRVEEAENEMYAAIDIAADKTQRQLRKYKTRVVDRKTRAHAGAATLAAPDDLPPVKFEDDEQVVRVKEVDLDELSEEEALVAMDLLGHDFFVYNDKTTGLTNVLYRRTAGGYGLIKPKVEVQD